MAYKVVRDPIHGNIPLDGDFIAILDTPQMQRLRHIKQNGLCYLVYPAMNSTRFEHSLGVYHLANLLTAHLELPKDDCIRIMAAALIHDMGHGPFSHTFDTIFEAHGLDHEGISCKLACKSEVTERLVQMGADPKDVSDLIMGKGRLGKLISSEVDVDKMDYLVRDAYYAGVAYGITDVERLLYRISLSRSDVIVGHGGLEAAESLLINRNMMYRTVYRHHTKRIAESMMRAAVASLIKGGQKAKEIMSWDDVTLISRLRGATGYPRQIMDMIDARTLFKRVFSEPLGSFTTASRNELAQNSEKVADSISTDLGIWEGHLLLDYPEASMNEYRVKVETSEGLKTIGEVSSLARSLEAAEQEKMTVNIYVHGESAKKFTDFDAPSYFTYEQTRLPGFT